MERDAPTGLLGSLSTPPPAFSRQGSGALLIVIVGRNQGQVARVGAEGVVVGSSEDCGLVLTDPEVSRRHLQVTREGAAIVLVDLGSKNGSFLGERRFSRETAAFGVEIRLGGTLLKVVPEEEALDPIPSKSTHAFGTLVGGTAAMRQIFSLISLVAPTDATVLLEGETGTGKELVAEELHRRSPRRDRPFVVFDCGAVPPKLATSVLFGHLRGAFTGAVADHAGLIREADGGTLFLDEIGELHPDLQPVLLRFLDRGVVQPVGGTRYAAVDVRIVAATHQSLAEMIRERRFREDLYHRLAVVRLTLPALRERIEDVPRLVHRFLRELGRPDLEPDPHLLERLATYAWPGNVRELRNFVEQAAAVATDPVLGPDSFAPLVLPPEASRADAAALAPAIRPFRESKAQAVEAFERRYLTQLAAEHASVAAAAEASEMDRKHLAMLFRRHGITLR